MGSSVAGSIRVDILADAARFKAGMQEAGREGFSGFEQEFQRFEKRFAGGKAIADRAQKEQSGWVKAMRMGDGPGTKGPLADAHGFMGGASRDLGLAKEVRYKSMLPWGMSMRTEMSKEAALTAAAIGQESGKIVKGLSGAMREIGGTAAASAGYGGAFSAVGKFAAGHPVLTAATIGVGYVANQMRERDILAREVRKNAKISGQSTEDTSKLMAVGVEMPMVSKFQRALSQKTPDQLDAFGKLGLDPEQLKTQPLLQSLTQVGEALNDRVTNPADRAAVAMSLFGRGGAEVIATLSDMKSKMDLVDADEIFTAADTAKVYAWDRALKEAKNSLNDVSLGIGRAFGTESGTGTQMARGASALIAHPIDSFLFSARSTYMSDAQLKEKHPDLYAKRERWAEDDAKVKNAPQIEKQRLADQKRADRRAAEAEAEQKKKDYSVAIGDVRNDISLMGETPEQTETRKKAKEHEAFAKGLNKYDVTPDETDPEKKRYVKLSDAHKRQLLGEYDQRVQDDDARVLKEKTQKEQEKKREQYQSFYERNRTPEEVRRDDTAKVREAFYQPHEAEVQSQREQFADRVKKQTYNNFGQRTEAFDQLSVELERQATNRQADRPAQPVDDAAIQRSQVAAGIFPDQMNRMWDAMTQKPTAADPFAGDTKNLLASERSAFAGHIQSTGATPEEFASRMKAFDATVAAIQEKTKDSPQNADKRSQADRQKSDARDAAAVERLARKAGVSEEELKLLRQTFAQKAEDSRKGLAIETELAKDYWQKKGMDLESMKQEVMTPYEHFQWKKDRRDEMAADPASGMTPELTAKLEAKDLATMRNEFGVKDHALDAANRIKDVDQAAAAGKLPPEARDLAIRRALESATAGRIADLGARQIQPVGAQTAGSREAHSTVAANAMADPRTKIAQDTLGQITKLVDDRMKRIIEAAEVVITAAADKGGN